MSGVTTTVRIIDQCNRLLLETRVRGLPVRRLDLSNSGDTAGSKDRVVGYGAWSFGASPRMSAVDLNAE